MSIHDAQLSKVQTQDGFLAALDQSGGSTPKALKIYGVGEDAYSGDEEMFTEVHKMRTRIILSPAFDGRRILGAILFENTMDRQIQGKPSAKFLWEEKNVVPFLKVDKGLLPEADGVQLMKPIADLDSLLSRANEQDVFGTKMRSVVKQANATGVRAIVEQQFELGKQILASGLVPILEPEVDIHCPDKAGAEELLKAGIIEHLSGLDGGQQIMLKLTLPERADFYADLIAHPQVLKVVALSGGYSRDDANTRLAKNHGMIASFSRALSQGLSAQQTDEAFNKMLGESIESIFQASRS